MAQLLKNLPAMQESQVQSLGWVTPLEKEIAIHSSVLVPGGSMGRGTGWATVHGVTKSRTLSDFIFTLNNREETLPCPSTENWIKELLSMAPPIRTRLSFPRSQSLPPGSLHKPLILICQRADRMKTTITGN